MAHAWRHLVLLAVVLGVTAPVCSTGGGGKYAYTQEQPHPYPMRLRWKRGDVRFSKIVHARQCVRVGADATDVTLEWEEWPELGATPAIRGDGKFCP